MRRSVPERRWVGWRPVEGRPLEMTFQFGGPREFHSVRIHVNNRASQGVKVGKASRAPRFVWPTRCEMFALQ